jgi:sterol desaturase/sphingolipid hydroxylase (fatty acid hydroxylase superfamily)
MRPEDDGGFPVTDWLQRIVSQLSINLTYGLTLLVIAFVIEYASVPADRHLAARHRLVNLLYWLTASVINVVAVGVVTVALVAVLLRAPGNGLFTLPRGGWLSGCFALVVVMVSRDFLSYWVHRWQHASRWLWVQHEFHHSDEHMNATTGQRHHWLDLLLVTALINAPVFYLFAPSAEVATLAIFFSGIHAHFQHINARMDFGRGWFSQILGSPQFHRIHHSKEPSHLDRNFAGNFPVWDLLFGTYYHAAANEYPETGLTHGRGPQTVAQAHAWPFLRWGQMLSARRRRRSAPAAVHLSSSRATWSLSDSCSPDPCCSPRASRERDGRD